jgi:hypothetical protein
MEKYPNAKRIVPLSINEMMDGNSFQQWNDGGGGGDNSYYYQKQTVNHSSVGIQVAGGGLMELLDCVSIHHHSHPSRS